MTYRTVADMHDSASLNRRLIACAAAEHSTEPEAFVWANHWALVASPGWGASWDSAVAGGTIEDPGADEGVITDGMILGALQPLMAAAAAAAG